MEKKKVAFVFNRQRTKNLDEAEFDTPEVVDAITKALSAKFEVVQIEMTRNASWVRRLEESGADVVLNTAEGYHGTGRESLAPICFEQLGFHYAGPGPYQCFLTLDKFLTKQVVLSAGVRTPEGFLIQSMSDLEKIDSDLTFPVFAKPNFEGSSKGITKDSFCPNIEALEKYVKKNIKLFPEGLLIERFINGKDITVPYLSHLGDDGVLEPVEYYRSDKEGPWIYDYDLKNEDDSEIKVRCPAKLDPNVIQAVSDSMKKVVNALSIVDMARADFRVTPGGDVFFIEINALPSLQPGAGIFEASKRIGLSYEQTIQHIVDSALLRKTKNIATKVPRRVRTRRPNVALVFNIKRKKPSDPGYEKESEFDSPETIQSIGKAIEKNGYKTEYVEMSKNLAEDLISNNINVVFNIAEGINTRTREAQVPAVCDLLNVEHTGGDATCLAITLDKATTNRIVSSEGIRVPKSTVVQKKSQLGKLNLSYPIIAKPNSEGTSKGIYENSVAENLIDLEKCVSRLENSMENGGILCEEFVVGREFTVGLLGNQNLKILGPSEIIFKNRGNHSPKHPVYSFEAKQAPNPFDNEFFRIECPAKIESPLERQIKTFAKSCFRVLGCRDVARIDFRVTPSNEIYFIEINPLPGLSPGFSDLSVLAEKSGMTYEDLIGHILKPAVHRWRKRHFSAFKAMG